VISLECTGTDLAKLVRPPRLVREIDWVDNCWPDIKRKRKQSHASAGMQDPKGVAHDKDNPMNGTSSLTAVVTHGNGVSVSDAAANDTVAGKRKLDGDGWPKVKLYCLMGKAGSWTVSAMDHMINSKLLIRFIVGTGLQDWHVDFAASCVYYTIISGCKVFYFIKPTPANLAAYARCESTSSPRCPLTSDANRPLFRYRVKR
jgi:F-box/leucine-rich repeat protein 10/11